MELSVSDNSDSMANSWSGKRICLNETMRKLKVAVQLNWELWQRLF